MESWILIVFITLSTGLYFCYSVRLLTRNRRLPPSPWGLPIVGHLHMLGKLPHRNLHLLAKKFGPIMYLRLGLAPAIVVSSPKWAELLLKTHDAVFASRAKMQATQCIWYGQKSLVAAQYGPYWRNMRKLCILEFLCASKIALFKSMRREELHNFVQWIKTASEKRSLVNISNTVESLIGDIAFRMVLGYKDKERSNIKESLLEAVELAGAFNVADYVPWLTALDIQGLGPRMRTVSKVLDDFLEKIINERINSSKDVKEQDPDFINAMLLGRTMDMHLDRDGMKAMVLDMLGASIDTTSTTIVWVISELLKNPRIMKLVQEELENIVGLGRSVEETDLIRLDYLKMVIKESLRIHPTAPLLIPHESLEDITINGYFIPKKTRVLINTWTIGRDPDIWSDNAEEFYPERFNGNNIDVQGHDFRFLPFGSGRRKCPGLELGMTIVQIVVAQLVHCFTLALPDGVSPDDLDMEEKLGVTLPRGKPLVAIPNFRLSNSSLYKDGS